MNDPILWYPITVSPSKPLFPLRISFSVVSFLLWAPVLSRFGGFQVISSSNPLNFGSEMHGVFSSKDLL